MSTITLHQSHVHSLRRCARRYYFEHELDGIGWEPVNVPWTAADFGTTMHRGLAAWHMTSDIDAALGALDARGVGYDGRPFGPPKDAHERAAARAVLRGYAAHYGAKDAATFEPVAAELFFSADALRVNGRVARGAVCRACEGSGRLDHGCSAPASGATESCHACHGRGHTGPRIEGTIDLVARAEQDGRQVIILPDHKTTGAKEGLDPLPVYLSAGAEIRIQAGMYCDAAVALGHPMPELFVYNYLRRPQFGKVGNQPKPKMDGSPRKMKEEVAYDYVRYGESPYEYEERLVRLIEDAPSKWFARVEVQVTPQLLSESRTNVLDTAAEIKWRRVRGAWPMNDASCTSYMQSCPWLPVCTGGQDPRDERLYRIKKKDEVTAQ